MSDLSMKGLRKQDYIKSKHFAKQTIKDFKTYSGTTDADDLRGRDLYITMRKVVRRGSQKGRDNVGNSATVSCSYCRPKLSKRLEQKDQRRRDILYEASQV